MPKKISIRPPTKAQLRSERKTARERFLRARKAGRAFERQLKQIAAQVGVIVNGLAPKGRVKAPATLSNALNKYAELIVPWAQSISAKLIADIDQKDASAWAARGREMGRILRAEINNGPAGEAMQKMMSEQVVLITSLPRKAAERVHSLTTEAISSTSARASEIAKMIEQTGHVTKSRAVLIARTEIARTASTLTQARAQQIGSEQYIWHTAGDSDVRIIHRKHNGRVFNWDDPPIAAEDGSRANPGMIYNCRCWAEPIIPDDL